MFPKTSLQLAVMYLLLILTEFASQDARKFIAGAELTAKGKSTIVLMKPIMLTDGI